MASPQVLDARRLVAASIQAQARFKGLWQEHGGLCWWQSGLPAMAANLVVSCEAGTDPRRLQSLARLMARSAAPAGWLLWPDQDPERQQPLLQSHGFHGRERIWLASLPKDRQAGPAFGQGAPQAGVVPVAALPHTAAPALAAVLEACHGIPSSVAGLVATTFVTPQPWSMPAQPAATLQLQTFAISQAGVPVATITAALLSPVAQAGVPPIGGLLWLGTHPQWRRRGFGRQVTLAACRWLRAEGVERIHVQASAAARSLYASLGFGDDGWLELWGCPPGPGLS